MAQGVRRGVDLILGAVDNYGFYDVSRFLVTLQQTGTLAHVCLYLGPNVSQRTADKIERTGAEVIRYGREFPFVAAPHGQLPKSIPAQAQIYCYRNFLYLDYLLKRAGELRTVLLTDVRDVVFQSDPFSGAIAHRLHVAMENRDIPIGKCDWTAGWMEDAYGPEIAERLSGKEMSCAGTVMGPAEQVQAYLEQMLSQLDSMRDPHKHADQPAHNFLLHKGALDPVERCYNFEGPMLTAGSETFFRFNADKFLVNRDGSTIPIVHQYDRHPTLYRLFDSRVRANPVLRHGAHALMRAANWWKRMRQRSGGMPK